MKQLEFKMSMQLNYDSPVHHEYFRLRCIPMKNETQLLLNRGFHILPERCLAKERRDLNGNTFVYGYIPEAHTMFGYEISGVVQVDLSLRRPEPMEESEHFLIPTPLTTCGPVLDSWLAELQAQLPEYSSIYDTAMALTHYINHKIAYLPGTTNMNTSAELAAIQASGVCQDETHIMLALCRKLHIPARYVAGLMTGEGATHAWAEVRCDDGIFYGFDPTNDRAADEQYIVLSHGSDCTECTVNAGSFSGTAGQQQTVQVWATERPVSTPEEQRDSDELTTLSDEINFTSFMFRNLHTEQLFLYLTDFEFALLNALEELLRERGSDNSISLGEIQQTLEADTDTLLSAAQHLEAHGLLHCTEHAEDRLAYAQFTEKGQQRLHSQRSILQGFYRQVIFRFGKEKTFETLQLLLELENVTKDTLNHFALYTQEV